MNNVTHYNGGIELKDNIDILLNIVVNKKNALGKMINYLVNLTHTNNINLESVSLLFTNTVDRITIYDCMGELKLKVSEYSIYGDDYYIIEQFMVGNVNMMDTIKHLNCIESPYYVDCTLILNIIPSKLIDTNKTYATLRLNDIIRVEYRIPITLLCDRIIEFYRYCRLNKIDKVNIVLPSFMDLDTLLDLDEICRGTRLNDVLLNIENNIKRNITKFNLELPNIVEPNLEKHLAFIQDDLSNATYKSYYSNIISKMNNNSLNVSNMILEKDLYLKQAGNKYCDSSFITTVYPYTKNKDTSNEGIPKAIMSDWFNELDFNNDGFYKQSSAEDIALNNFVNDLKNNIRRATSTMNLF